MAYLSSRSLCGWNIRFKPPLCGGIVIVAQGTLACAGLGLRKGTWTLSACYGGSVLLPAGVLPRRDDRQD
jgi:hypothetical protein